MHACRDILSVLSSGRCWEQGSMREWVRSQVPDLRVGRGGWAGIVTGSIRSQVPGSSLFVNPTVSVAAGSSRLVSMPTRAV
jgi:hypothetical protein